MEALAGIFCALWTPTDGNGEILWNAVDKHLSFVFESGADGLMALGTTAEFLHLNLDQRKALLTRLAAGCKRFGRKLVANVSEVQIRHVVELARCAESVGADCIAVLPPWYFPLEPRDLAEFFIEAGRATRVPLALYNFPEVTGKQIDLATIEAVASKVRVVAFKQSGGDFAYHHELMKLARKLGFVVLTGWDTRLAEALQIGCTGTISGLSNAVPEILSRIYACARAGKNTAEDTAIVAEVARLMSPLKFPFNVRATIAARGLETGVPKFPMSEETRRIYDLAVHKLREFYQSHALPIHTASNS